MSCIWRSFHDIPAGLIKVLPKDNVQWGEERDEGGIAAEPHVNVDLDDNLSD